jgi:hypothetical protein
LIGLKKTAPWTALLAVVVVGAASVLNSAESLAMKYLAVSVPAELAAYSFKVAFASKLL